MKWLLPVILQNKFLLNNMGLFKINIKLKVGIGHRKVRMFNLSKFNRIFQIKEVNQINEETGKSLSERGKTNEEFGFYEEEKKE